MSTLDQRRANPIKVSIARVIDRTAKRLGYRWVAICENCGQAVIIRLDEVDAPRPIWRHRNDMDEWCPHRQPDAEVVA